MLDEARVELKAMILLGANCGFGNNDCGALPITALDLAGGWVDFPRPKTGEPRRCPLWGETIAALRQALSMRPEPASGEYAGLAFLTRAGFPWVRMGTHWQDNVGVAMATLLTRLGIKRPGLSFYGLRHTFATIGGETTDQVAVNAIMGHSDSSMASVYREGISDDRLIAVSDHARRRWYGVVPRLGQEAWCFRGCAAQTARAMATQPRCRLD